MSRRRISNIHNIKVGDKIKFYSSYDENDNWNPMMNDVCDKIVIITSVSLNKNTFRFDFTQFPSGYYLSEYNYCNYHIEKIIKKQKLYNYE